MVSSTLNKDYSTKLYDSVRQKPSSKSADSHPIYNIDHKNLDSRFKECVGRENQPSFQASFNKHSAARTRKVNSHKMKALSTLLSYTQHLCFFKVLHLVLRSSMLPFSFLRLSQNHLFYAPLTHHSETTETLSGLTAVKLDRRLNRTARFNLIETRRPIRTGFNLPPCDHHLS